MPVALSWCPRGCIYCAGQNVANTIEHMPPISMFEDRQRPKGMEFPACKQCNNNTGHSDLVAAMLSRMWPDAGTDLQKKDVARLVSAVANNIPALIVEMDVGRAGRKLAKKRLNLSDDMHVMRADGPLMMKHMQIFASKLGFALHHEVRGAPIPADGGVLPMWFSNVQALRGEIPSVLFELLPSPTTLQQGVKSAKGQFDYSFAVAERDHMLYFASFNRSFAVAGMTALDRSIYLETHTSRFPVVKPGDFITSHF
jgi:hypothetical protein